MIKIAVLDDSESDRSQLGAALEEELERRGEKYSVFLYEKPFSLLAELDQDEDFDLFFLDMELPGIDGLGVAREIRRRVMEPPIVYVTSHAEYSIQAFEVEARRYIIKEKHMKEKLSEALDVLLPRIKAGKRQKSYVTAHYTDVEKIPYDEIYWMKKEEKYVRIYHKRGTSFVRKSLQALLKELNAREFLEISRDTAVNICHVMKLQNGFVEMRNDDKLPVKQQRLERVKKEIMKYWMG